MKNKLSIMVMLVCALVASYTGMAQGFIGNGTGTGTYSVNSSGTQTNVNVGIGVMTPTTGVTLEVKDQGRSGTGFLGLQFDNLPTPPTTSDVLYYDPITGIVTYGSGTGVTSVDYDCGVGTLVITPSVGSPFHSTYKAWLLSGSTTASTDYFGTYNDDDIRISTYNNNCNFDAAKQKMIIAKDGSVGIGSIDVSTNLPIYPQNSLLVQRGLNTVLGGSIYSLVGHDYAIIATETKGATGSTNSALLAVTTDDNSTNNSITSYTLGNTSTNTSVNISSSGNNSNNTGFRGNVGGSSGNNTGYNLSVDGSNATNTGGSITVGPTSTTSTNTGISMNVSGSSAFNAAIYATVNQSSTNTNEGVALFVSGDVSNQNVGIVNNVGIAGGTSPTNTGVQNNVTGSSHNYGENSTGYGDDVGNFGVLGQARGNGTTGANNIGVNGNIYILPLGSNANSKCVGVLGSIQSGADGTSATSYNYGVWGDLSHVSRPSSGNTVPYFAVYGVAPPSTGSIASAPASGTPYSNTYYSYAGYFDGDIFCSSAYYYSDPKLKENIQTYTGALDQLKKLPVKTYTFRNSEFPKMNLPLGDQVGVLSTDMKAAFPNLVKGGMHPGDGKDDPRVTFEAVNYNALIPVLVEAVQELDAKATANPANDDLAKTIATQQAQIAAQSQQLTEQSKQIAELRMMVEDICSNGCAGFKPNTNPTNGSPAVSGSAVLYQSTPNPTSGSAVIAYTINMPFSTASIQVSDKGGKTIRQYAIQQQGAGSVTFEGSAIAAAGSYTYSLIIDGRVYDTKTMMILKD